MNYRNESPIKFFIYHIFYYFYLFSHKNIFFQEIITGKKRAHKRKRKVILPKNFDPKVPPDPERWLPKQERTAYRKKLNKKHRDRDIGRGTQGAVSSSPKMCVFELL